MAETDEILNFLEYAPGAPSLRQLNRLIDAYVRAVPWESVFRIAKRAAVPDPSQRPRWPVEFWRDAIHLGGGGTCFEINYALFKLLEALGYRAYLTVNDMGEQRGCHAAVVAWLGEAKYLVDAGIPLLAALRIDPTRAARRATWMHTYTVQPDGADRYQILRTRHPKPNAYTLIDTPVPEADYRRVLAQDYGEHGLFLDRVIVVKVIGNRVWRFSSAEKPYRLESFGRDGAQAALIGDGQSLELAARAVAGRFGMAEDRVAAALRAVGGAA